MPVIPRAAEHDDCAWMQGGKSLFDQKRRDVTQ